MKAISIVVLSLLTVACGKTHNHTNTKLVEVAPKAAPKLTCKVYDMTGQSLSALPTSMSSLPLLGSVEVESLNNPNSNNVTPFNSFLDTDLVEQVELFGMVCTGTLSLKTSGAYSFYTNSDDGTKLFINGFQVVANDGNHGIVKKGATVTLLAGNVDVRLEYFNGYGDKALVLSMKQPNVSFEELIKF